MPSLQVVDLSERPADKPEPTQVERLFSEYKKYKKERKEGEEIQKLTNRYLENKNQEGAWEKLQFDLMNNQEIGPSKRLETQAQLKEMRAQILKEREVLAKEAKEQKDLQVKEKGAEALRQAGATEDQIALYNAADQGGRTKVIGDILESVNRTKTPQDVPQNLKDYDSGLTPKERVKRQDARFTTQTPLVMKNSEALKAAESEGMSIDLLGELEGSGKIGKGFSNLNINPKTGDLFLPKAANAEEQLFVKTVNDFTVKAKDSFGARVTNFELDRFMQRLPTLANSSEGRKLILRQMKIINELNQIEKSAIQDVFDEYGIRNIDYADAENIARERIKEKKEELRKEYINIEKVAKQEESELSKKAKENVKSGYVVMKTPEGKIKQFPEKNVQNLLDKGYIKL